MSGRLIAFAPAKVNLALRLLGRRSDGYHEIVTVLQAVDLFDRLVVTPAAGLEVTCDSPDVPGGRENIVYRALAVLGREIGAELQLAIRIEKRIPVAAGLGGGSADAAAALQAACRAAGVTPAPERLAEIAARIGMDVPFFLAGGSARATGRGERIERLPPLPGLDLLLVTPPVPVSTAVVYGQAGAALTSPDGVDKFPRLGRWRDLAEIAGSLRNDLEPVTARAHPVVTAVEAGLIRRGAVAACMSGSGPTVFGIFADPARWTAAEEAFRAEGNFVARVRSWDRGCVIEDE